MSIDVSARLAAVLASRSFRMVCRATITRGRSVLAADLPVDTGREECDGTLRVPERVSLQIPRIIDGMDWSAAGTVSPILPFGQRLHVKLGIDVGADGMEWINRGEFLIHDTEANDRSISINAVGLLALVDEAQLVSPFKPTGTLLSSVRRLVEPAVTVRAHPDLVDRAVNTGLAMDDNRLSNLELLLDSWPAYAQMQPEGYLLIIPGGVYGDHSPDDVGMYLQRRAFPGNNVPRANIVSTSTSASRDGIVNAVVVRGTASNGAPVQASVYDQTGGPTSYGGPFNPLPVPTYYSHAAATTKQIAGAMARYLLNQRSAPWRESWRAEVVPQPRLLLNDAVNYYPEASFESVRRVYIQRLVLPYTAASGPMQVTVREVPA